MTPWQTDPYLNFILNEMVYLNATIVKLPCSGEWKNNSDLIDWLFIAVLYHSILHEYICNCDCLKFILNIRY